MGLRPGSFDCNRRRGVARKATLTPTPSAGLLSDSPRRCARLGLDRLTSLWWPSDGASVVAAEGYAITGHAAAGFHLGELGGVLQAHVAVQAKGTPLYTVPPASVKKFATGQGNASKEAVLVAAVHVPRLCMGNSDRRSRCALDPDVRDGQVWPDRSRSAYP